MLESIVAGVLNKVLGEYVANLEQKQLKLGIFNGNVVLRNLRLRTDALDKLKLPIDLCEGFLGRLELHIPWANLKTQPVRVEIADLFVLAAPKCEAEYDAVQEEQCAQRLKRELLDTAELIRRAEAAKLKEAADGSFMTSLVTKIVDNLQVVIKNIHVRFEDSASRPSSPSALGLTLAQLSAVSTDGQWTEVFIDDPGAPTHKLARLDSLAVYWMPQSDSWRHLPAEQLMHNFHSLIYSADRQMQLRYLLKPVSGTGRVVLNKKPLPGAPQHVVNVEFDGFNLKLDNEQYYAVLMLAQNFIFASRSMQYRKHRPARAVTPLTDPKAWLRYAVVCVLERIRARNLSRSWIAVIKRRQIRKKYVLLFQRLEVAGALGELEAAALGTMEEMLSVEDIQFYRSLARRDMKEKGLIPHSLKVAQSKAAGSGIFARWWSGSDAASSDSDVVIKDEDVQRFYDTIGYDAQAKAQALSPTAQLLQITFDLRSGSVALARTTGASTRKTIMSLQYVNLHVSVLQRPDTLRVELRLQDLSVLESLMEASIFSTMVRAKHADAKLDMDEHGQALPASTADATNEMDEIQRLLTKNAAKPFLSFVMDQLTGDANAEKAITLSMQPLEIVFNHQAVTKLMAFVYDDRIRVAFASLASVAETTISQLAHKTRANLDHALAKHKSTNLSVDIDAPVIFIPYDCEDPDGFLLVGDLGHIQVRSRLVTSQQKEEFSRKRKHLLSAAELESLYNLMYDVLIVKLTQIKLSYAKSMAEWQHISQDPEFLPEANRIIDDIDVSMSIGSCIVPRATNLAQTKIFGKIPSVRLMLSDEKYRNVMRLLEVLAPKPVATGADAADAPALAAPEHAIFKPEPSVTYGTSLAAELEPGRDAADSGDEFFDALDEEPAGRQPGAREPPEEAEFDAINVDLVLSIDEIRAKIAREHAKYPTKELVTLVAKKLRIAMHAQPFNTLVNVILEAFYIRDDLNSGFEGMPDVFLLSGKGEASSESSLLRVNVNLVDPKHPLFESTFKGAGLQVLLELAALNLYLNPSTVVQLAEFLDTLTEGPVPVPVPEGSARPVARHSSSHDQATALSRSNTARSSVSEFSVQSQRPVGPVAGAKPAPPKPKVLLNAQLKQLAIKLGIGSEHFSDILFSSAVAGMSMDGDDVHFNGKIADLVISHVGPNKHGSADFLRIDGEHVLDVTYKTFASLAKDGALYPGFDQFVKLTSGALHFTYDSFFVEDACSFALKWAKEARLLAKKRRQLEGAGAEPGKSRRGSVRRGSLLRDERGLATIPEGAPVEQVPAAQDQKLHFEIDISSPIVDLPNQNDFQEMLSIYLGRIHASNAFVGAAGVADQIINAQLEALRMVLTMRQPDSEYATRQLLDDVGITAKISQMANALQRDYADSDVDVDVSSLRLKLANSELKCIMGIARALGQSVEKANRPLSELKKLQQEQERYENRQGERTGPSVDAAVAVEPGTPMPVSLELMAVIKSIELVLYEAWETQPLGHFALDSLHSHLIQSKDQSMIFEQYIGKIQAFDLRPEVVKRRRYTQIIQPGSTDGGEKYDVKFKFEQTADADQIVRAEVLAPHIVLSVDFLQAVSKLLDGLSAPAGAGDDAVATPQHLSIPHAGLEPDQMSEISAFSGSSPSSPLGPGAAKKAFILAEIKGMCLYILEEPDSTSSEALKLSINRIAIAQRNNISVAVEGVAAGFISMEKAFSGPESVSMVQFIDPFDVTATVELGTTRREQITQVWAVIKPIVVQFSYQDLQMFQNIGNQFKAADAAPVEPMSRLSIPDSSINDSAIFSDDSPLLASPVSVASKRITELVQIDLEGLRVMFIDDFAKVHIPFLDIAVDQLAAEIKDWSTNPTLSGVLKMHVNFFNRLNSHWEPVVEPWSLDLSLLTHLQEDGSHSKFNEVKLASDRVLDVVASHAFVEQLLLLSDKMSKVAPRAASAYRTVAKPYLIRNYTGYSFSIWSDARVDAADGQPEMAELPSGGSLPYEFEDWRSFRRARQRVSGKISIHLMNTPWESIKNISLEQHGIFVYPLRPKLNSVSHKLICQISIVDGIRHVIFRSATCFKNSTQYDVEIRDFSSENVSETLVVRAGEVGSLPIMFSAGGAFEVRPVGLDQYLWSTEKFELHGLLHPAAKSKHVVKRALCPATDRSSTPFCLCLHGMPEIPEEVVYGSATLARSAAHKRSQSSLDKFYALGTITIAAPIELENLLPYDFKYRIYDRDGRYDFSGALKQGEMSPIHGVDSSHVIGISIEIDSKHLKTKQIALISSGTSYDHDDRIELSDAKGKPCSLSIDVDTLNRFGTRRVRIYSPYVIINQTGLPLAIKSTVIVAGIEQEIAAYTSEADQCPLLFNYSDSSLLPGKNRIKIKASSGAREWGKPLSLDAIGSVINFELPYEQSWLNLSLHVRLGSERFSRCHVVTIAPRFWIQNRLGDGVRFWLRSKDEHVLEVADGAKVPLHCDPSVFRKICVSFDERVWSVPFSIAEVGESFIKVPGMGARGAESLIKISKVLQVNVLYLVLSRERHWPYRIENKSSVELRYGQRGFLPMKALLPGQIADFAWDDPNTAEGTLRIGVYESERSIDLSGLGPCRPLVYHHPGKDLRRGFLGIDVSADGPTIVVRFNDFDPRSKRNFFSFAAGRKSQDELSDSSSHQELQLKEAKDYTEFVFSLNLAGVGISLIGPNLAEFMYIFGKGVELRLQQSRLFQTIGFKIKWLQVDNQLFDYTHPILLYPTVVKKTEEELNEHPTVNLGIILNRLDRGVTYVKYFGVLLQEMSLELGEEQLRKLIEFAQFEQTAADAVPSASLLSEADFELTPLQPNATDNRLLYFELLQIHPIKINCSFSRIEESANSVDETMVASAGNPFSPLRSILSMASGNISEAPLKFNSLLLEHPLVTAQVLQSRIVGHYVQQAIVQVHKIVGSIDMLGNPVGLVTTMGSAVTDLFYEPYQGFVSDRPQDIGIGLARGGISFVKKTVSGLTGTFSKLTGSLGKGLAAASMDAQFQRTRRTDYARNRPTTAASGITTGARSLYKGIASGITGIVEKPLEGAKQSGIGGFLKGVGVGMLGALTKPIVGAIDMTTSVSEGVRGAVDGSADSEIAQTRCPRIIPYDSVITTYSAREAFGQTLLAGVLNLDLRHERYYTYLEVREDDAYAILTNFRILYVKRDGLSIVWQVLYGELMFARPNFDSVMLSVRQGEIRKRLIFCLDQSNQEWFCIKIDEALALYNERHRTLE